MLVEVQDEVEERIDGQQSVDLGSVEGYVERLRWLQ